MSEQRRRSARTLPASVLALFVFAGPLFSQTVPRPEEVLGFEVGSDFHLATYEQAVEYFRALEKASPLMRVFDMGPTEMGRTMIYGLITSEKTMAELERHQEISRRLSLAKDLTDDEARRLAAEGKAVVWIDAGIHATECAPAQAMIQFAYDLLTADDPDTRLILDNTIVLLVFANPDGMTLVADWYRGRGYHFLVLSDHNVLSQGETWFPVQEAGRLTPQRLETLRPA